MPGSIPDELAPVDQNPHYVRSVTELGEENEVIAQEDIFAANGMKLLAKGAKVNRSTWQRLTAHKLKTPLDLQLAAADTVDEVALARDIGHLLVADTILAAIAVRSGDPQAWKAMLGARMLSPPIAFRLTVMRDRRADLYRHSLRIAVIAHCIGMRMKLSSEQARNLFLAALCHDFGEMHTAPLILAPGHRIDRDEQRFVYVHPLTGYIVLQQMNCVPPEVMQAVRQHHERLDGSGYPYGEPEAKIVLLARIIAVSETLDAVLGRFGLRRVNIVLRLSQGRLDSDCMHAASELLPAQSQKAQDMEADFAPEKELTRLSDLMQTWGALHEKLKDRNRYAALEFISGRIAALEWLALQAGLTPELLQMLDLDGEDTAVVQELSAMLEELNRLLDSLALEIDRRVPAGAPGRDIADAILATLRPEVKPEVKPEDSIPGENVEGDTAGSPGQEHDIS